MNFVFLSILALVWIGIECCIGGTRLIFSLPFYSLLSIAGLLSLASIRAKRPPPDALCLGATLLLGAWILSRAWLSPFPHLARPDFFMMIGCLMAYLLTAFYITRIRDQTILVLVLWAIASLEIWVAVVQFIKDPGFMLFGLLRPPGPRPSGMYISPNNFAGFLAAVAVISLSFGVWSRWRGWAKMLAVYVAIVCLAGVAISGSRGGYFAAIGSLLCFAAGSIYAIRAVDPRRFLPVAICSLGGLAAVIALAAFLMGHSELLSHRMQTMVTKDVRIYNWLAALDHIRVNPWIGTGSGTHLVYGRLFRRPEIQADPVHAHCDYLELLAEYGIAGAACMALFLAAHTRRALRTYSEILHRRLIPSGFYRSNSFALQLGALCAVAGLAVHSVVDFDMHIPANALIFAFLFAVIANPGMERPPGFANRSLFPFAKLLLPALAILMLWRGAPLIPSEYCSELARCSLRNHALVAAIKYCEEEIGPTSQDIDLRAAIIFQNPDTLCKVLTRTGPDPTNPDVYFYLGEANRAIAEAVPPSQFLHRHYLFLAAAAFKAGLKVFPLDESMLVRYGETLDALRQYSEAEPVYQKALAWDPNLNVLHQYYEAHLTAEGKKAEADAFARRQDTKASVVDTVPNGDVRLQ